MDPAVVGNGMPRQGLYELHALYNRTASRSVFRGEYWRLHTGPMRAPSTLGCSATILDHMVTHGRMQGAGRARHGRRRIDR
eukprot:6098076-Pyramimonas_sp.AAC.2